MKQNISDFNAFCNLVGGLTLFGMGIIKKSKPAVLVGSMRIASGVTKWCPVTALLGKLKTDECCDVEEEVSDLEEVMQES